MKIFKFLIVFVLITLAIFAIPPKTTATNENNLKYEPVEIKQTFKDKLVQADLPTRHKLILEKIKEYTEKKGVNPKEVFNTIKCENRELNTNIQSNLKYNFNSKKRNISKGERERSYGLAMIHLPDHPNISKEQATDPEFALIWMVEEFANNRKSQWTCYKKLYW